MSPTQSVVTVDIAVDNRSPGGAFVPNFITASNGTVVSFRFSGIPGNHSVTQSTLVAPCQPLQNGFDSGFVIGSKTKQGLFPTFNYTVTNDQAPTWFYCKQQLPSSHCRADMVGVINGHPAGFTQFQAKAQGSAVPQGSTLSSATASPTTSAISSSETPIVGKSKSSLSQGAIAGITIGALLLLILLIGALLFRGRRLRRQRALEDLTRPSPNLLIASEKGPMPPDGSVSILSSILREMRSLRRQGRGGNAVDANSRARSSRDPPPRYTASL